MALLLGITPAVFQRPVHRIQGAGDDRAGAESSRGRQGVCRHACFVSIFHNPCQPGTRKPSKDLTLLPSLCFYLFVRSHVAPKNGFRANARDCVLVFVPVLLAKEAAAMRLLVLRKGWQVRLPPPLPPPTEIRFVEKYTERVERRLGWVYSALILARAGERRC